LARAPERDQVALGHPSYVWRFGQDRRLSLIQRYAALEGARILDIGCGIGQYVRHFRAYTPHAYGIDIDAARVRRGAADLPGLMVAASEHLPFRDGVFDLVLLNEVIEHVSSDDATLREAVRVLRPGGYTVIFAPNRFFPFETHGVYLGRRYRFGNIPLVNYLPDLLRNRLAPHARAYTRRRLRRMIMGSEAQIVHEGYVFPGFDNIIERRPRLGRFLRAVCYRAERTPLAVLGLSHFVVLRKPGVSG